MHKILVDFGTETELYVRALDNNAKEAVQLNWHLVPISTSNKAGVYACFVLARINDKLKKRGKIDNIAVAKSREAELAKEMERLGPLIQMHRNS